MDADVSKERYLETDCVVSSHNLLVTGDLMVTKHQFSGAMQMLLFIFLVILFYIISVAAVWAKEEEISIEGKLLMLDNSTPHLMVCVQAIQNEEVVAVDFSRTDPPERGLYQLVNLQPGLKNR